MGVFLVRAVRNTIVVTPDITYAVSVSAASCDEGATSPTITITRNLNGGPAQDSSVRFRTLNSTEFATEFPGETQALASDFVADWYVDLQPACVAAGIGIVHFSGQYDQLIWTAGSDASVSFTRTAKNQPEEQGDKRSAYTLTDPSVGTVSVAIASFEIIDTFVAPSSLEILDVGLVYTLRRTTAVPGEVVCWIEASAGAIASGGVSLENDAGGKFAVGTPVANRYPIITTSTPADFEGATDTTGQTIGTSRERISVEVLGTLAEVVDVSINIWPEMPLIDVTGDETATNTDLSTASAVYTALSSTTSNRTLSVAAGIYKNPSPAAVRNDDRSNATWRGIRGAVLRVGRGPEIRKGRNKLYKNISFRAGAHYVTEAGGNPANVDNLVGGMTNDSTRLEWVKFENCSFSLSWDELMSIINVAGAGPYPRGIWFERCLFHSPLSDQRDGSAHVYGPIVAYEKCNWVVVNKCTFASCTQRSPFVGRARQILLQNNVHYYRATNTTGHSAITIKAGNSYLDDQDISIIIRGNLLKCEEGLNQATGRSVAIGVQALGLNSYINAHFDDPPYENHFFQHATGTPLFADDPLILASHVRKQVGTTDAALASSFVDFDPFIGPDYDYLPTDTEANRQALWENVMNYAGNRVRTGDPYDGALVSGDSALDRFDYNAMQRLRTTGNRPGPLYATVDSEYGTAWDGTGGSLGYAMNATPP